MESSEETVEILKRISNDIHAMRMSTNKLARNLYLQDLSRIASTAERQEIWRKCEGVLSTEQISTTIGVAIRTVQYFVQEAERAGLIEYVKRGYPKRVDDFNIIPAEWKPFSKAVAPPPQETLTGKVE